MLNEVSLGMSRMKLLLDKERNMVGDMEKGDYVLVTTTRPDGEVKTNE